MTRHYLAFDLGAGTPVRATLVRCGATEQVLMLTIHHIATDAASNAVLLADLARAYRDGDAGPRRDYGGMSALCLA